MNVTTGVLLYPGCIFFEIAAVPFAAANARAVGALSHDAAADYLRTQTQMYDNIRH